MNKFLTCLVLGVFLLSIVPTTTAASYSYDWNDSTRTATVNKHTLLSTNPLLEIKQVSVVSGLTTFEEVVDIYSHIDYTLTSSDLKWLWTKHRGEHGIYLTEVQRLVTESYVVTVNDYGDVEHSQAVPRINEYVNVTDAWNANPWNLDLGVWDSKEKWDITYYSVANGTNVTGTVGFDRYEVISTNPLKIKFFWNVNEQIGTHEETRYREVFKQFSPFGKTIHNGQTYTIKTILHKKAEVGEFSIHLTPEIAGVVIKELTWWNSSWMYFTESVLTDVPAGGHVYNLTIHSAAGANNQTDVFTDGHNATNFTDIRFTFNDVTELAYWIEDNLTDPIKVWVNVTGNGTIGLYYGNNVVGSTSNISNTFVWGDDFEDGDTSDWTHADGETFTATTPAKAGSYGGKSVSTGSSLTQTYYNFGVKTCDYVVEWDWLVYPNSDGERRYIVIAKTAGSYEPAVSLYVTGADYFKYYSGGDHTIFTYFSDGVWFKMKIIVNMTNSQFDLYVNGTQKLNNAGTHNSLAGQIQTFGLRRYSAVAPGYQSVDNIFVYEYLVTRPSWAAWAAEVCCEGVIPPTPINIVNTNGICWCNYSWEPGVGNITNSYCVLMTVDGSDEWHNGSSNTYLNTTGLSSDNIWVNISVYAYNNTGNISLSSLDDGTLISCYFVPPVPTNLHYEEDEGWINHIWDVGVGNVTTSYNLTIDGVPHNGSNNTYYNNSAVGGSHPFSSFIVIKSYNSTSDGTLSLTNVSENISIANFAPYPPIVGFPVHNITNITDEVFNTGTYESWVGLTYSDFVDTTVIVHNTTTIVNETFNSSTYDTWISLYNTSLISNTQKVTNMTDEVAFTNTTDYLMNYTGGKIKILSGGSMLNHTEYHIDYDYTQYFDTLVDFEMNNTDGTIKVLESGSMMNDTNYKIDYNYNDNTTKHSNGLYLKWNCTDRDGDSLTYDVYFSKVGEDLRLVSEGQSGNMFHPYTLDNETDYQWKIVATDNWTTPLSTEGDVWNFTTEDSDCPVDTYSLTVIARDVTTSIDLDQFSGELSTGEIRETICGETIFTCLESGYYDIVVSADGYEDEQKSIVMDQDKSLVVYVTPISSVDYFIPDTHEVLFFVQDMYGNPKVNVNVTVTTLETTMGSWSWLADYFGFDNTASIQDAVMTGSTDSSGSITFMMIETIKYNLHFVNATQDIDETLTIYPKENFYLIIVGGAFDWFGWMGDEEPDIGGKINWNFTKNIIDDDNTWINVTFNASLLPGTNSVYFWINASNNTFNIHNETWDGSDYCTFNHTITNYSGNAYYVGFEAVHATKGTIREVKVLYFKEDRMFAIDGFKDSYYQMLSVVILFFVAALFSGVTIKVGAIILPTVALGLWYIGWYSSWILVMVTMSIGVLFYIKSRGDETKQGG